MIERKVRYGESKTWLRQGGRKGIENDEEKESKKWGNGKKGRKLKERMEIDG